VRARHEDSGAIFGNVENARLLSSLSTKLLVSNVSDTMRSSQTNPANTRSPRETPAEALKRRVYLVIVLLGLPGIYTAWSANRIEQPFMANAYICLGVGVLFTLTKILNRRVSVIWIERFGFVMTVLIVLANVMYTDYFSVTRGPAWRESRETSHWLIAYLCVFAYAIFDTRIGLRVASAIAAVAFLFGLLGVQSQQNPSELYSLIRYTSISTALLAFTYLLAYTKEQLNLERVRSSTDDLTGLLNRRALYAALETEFGKTHDNTKSLAVILIDVDRFKNINDTFGHAAGDQVLIGIAEILGQHSPRVPVGRWGGEEFLVLLPNTNLESVLATAEKLRVKLEEYLFEIGTVTASFGVACLQVGESPSDLLRRADLSLYAAKSRGRNRVEHTVRVIDHLEDTNEALTEPRESLVA
jgi:diguanylate cyclase (GGDEF)-like protein